MTFSTLIMVTAIALIVMAWYANTSKRDKILCTFRRVNKTKIVKWVKMKNKFVIFDDGKYDIIPSRITFQWYTGGLIHMLFPQWVATLDYSYTSRFPHDPNNMAITAESPETRKALNKQEWVTSYYRGAEPKAGKTKVSLIEKYLPWVAIVLVVVVAFYLYNSQQTMAHKIATDVGELTNRINAITK